jgi:serine/threonine protein kinase
MFKVGSPLYMPPETLKNSLYSLKTDSFALGILFFYIITRRYPWAGKDNKELL